MAGGFGTESGSWGVAAGDVRHWLDDRLQTLVGFVGTGTAWNNLEHYDNSQSTVTGRAIFRYELARKHGIHTAMDVAFGPDTATICIQVGSAWMRP